MARPRQVRNRALISRANSLQPWARCQKYAVHYFFKNVILYVPPVEASCLAAQALFAPPWRFSSGCSCGKPIGLDEEIGGDFPACIDLLDHLQGQGAAPSQTSDAR